MKAIVVLLVFAVSAVIGFCTMCILGFRGMDQTAWFYASVSVACFGMIGIGSFAVLESSDLEDVGVATAVILLSVPALLRSLIQIIDGFSISWTMIWISVSLYVGVLFFVRMKIRRRIRPYSLLR